MQIVPNTCIAVFRVSGGISTVPRMLGALQADGRVHPAYVFSTTGIILRN